MGPEMEGAMGGENGTNLQIVKKETDVVSAILTHVSLMIAGLAFVFQLADRISSPIYRTSKAASELALYGINPSGLSGFRTPRELLELGVPEPSISIIFPLKTVSPIQIWFSEWAANVFDFSIVMLMLLYLYIAMKCLKMLKTVSESVGVPLLVSQTRVNICVCCADPAYDLSPQVFTFLLRVSP